MQGALTLGFAPPLRQADEKLADYKPHPVLAPSNSSKSMGGGAAGGLAGASSLPLSAGSVAHGRCGRCEGVRGLAGDAWCARHSPVSRAQLVL
jgi:hypothetical protein